MTPNNVAAQLAKYLLEVGAVKLAPVDHPFTWASGWLSPIYCDTRLTLSYPEVRTFICENLVALIREKFPDVTAISGVATGGIAQGALVADRLNLPFSYIRSSAKDHGTHQQVEGVVKEGDKVVVVEDLVSTGGSSLKAVDAIRGKGVDVLGMVALYTHGFPQAEEAFGKTGNLPFFTLSDYDAVIGEAKAQGLVSEEDLATLLEWRKNPGEWRK